MTAPALVVRDLGPGVATMTIDSPRGQTVVINTRERLSALVPPPTDDVVEVHPTSTPASDLPLAMVTDVAKVLRARGLDPDLLALSSALYGVTGATSVEHGGSAVTDRG